MITGRYFRGILFLFLFSFCISSAIAQPTLPDIAGSTDKGIVILSWICQFNGVKSITVLHSMDSVRNFSETGHVKNREKGIQAFADGHPAAGMNYYKVSILFNSGLLWMSNHCRVYVDKPALDKLQMTLPGNDSLQKYIVTVDVNKAADTITGAIINSTVKNKPQNDNVMQPKPARQAGKPDTSKLISDTKEHSTKTDTIGKHVPLHKILVAFEYDSSDLVIVAPHGNTQAIPSKKKISITFVDPSESSTTFIKSRFIYTDVVTGHVKMELPDDVKSHHYSVKFYDEQNRALIEIPRVNNAKTIIDRRNFQHGGIYKFVIRRDVTEFERGYIMVNP